MSWRRHLITASVCAALGAVSVVAVVALSGDGRKSLFEGEGTWAIDARAQGCAEFEHTAVCDTYHVQARDALMTRLAGLGPDEWIDLVAASCRDPDRKIDTYLAEEADGTGQGWIVRRGWPLRCFQSVFMVRWRTAGSSFEDAVTKDADLPPGRIPGRIVWPAFVMNAACFGAARWAAAFGAFAIFTAARRARRRAKGRCGVCGYPVVAGAHCCPECGDPTPPAKV